MKKIFIIVLALLLVFVVRRNVFAQTAVSSTATFPGGSGADDIDDMAVWVHPTDKSKSIIIGSDKYGDKIFVWEMGGTLIQTITGIGQPGNIDLAYNFPLSGTSTDIVAVNERNTDLVRIYKVNPSTRQLERVDDGNIKTSGDNYGVCFYKSPTSGKYYTFLNHYRNGVVEQFELNSSGGKVTGNVVRNWDIGGQTEACVADHKNKVVYFAEEENALWRYGAEPSDSTSSRTRVVGKGENGFSGNDAEGVTMYYKSDGGGYLILSDQGNNEFMVFDRNSNNYINTFKISGVSDTDGIDVSNVNFGGKFASGIFLAHNNSNSTSVYAVDWQKIASALGLNVDTSFDPRSLFGGPTPSNNPNPPTSTPTAPPTSNPTTPPSPGNIATEPNFKVAFVGDTNYGTNFNNVLNIIKAEGADLVMHQGDFDYSYDPNGFFSVVSGVLGTSFPYLGSVGNHDISSWNDGCGKAKGCYATHFKQRMAANSITPDSLDLNDQNYSAVYKGLKMVYVGDSSTATYGNTNRAPYVKSQLANDNHIWKICSWHKNMTAMQLGTKGDEMGWDVYENCREAGAIIATGHEHTYERTKTLTDVSTQTVDTVQHPVSNNIPGNPNNLLVAPGKTFVFVQGAGGDSMRNQDRCLPVSYPYGCKYEWAKVYTSDQGAKYGALFIEFYVDGDPYKARGYFKNTSGEVIDSFTITKANAGPTSQPTTPPTGGPTSQPTSGPTTPPTGAPIPPDGDGSHLQTISGSSTSATNVSSQSLSASQNNYVYVAAISTRPSGQASSVSGLGLNWQRAKYQCAGRNATGTDIWYAVGKSNGGQVTANLGTSRSSGVIGVSVFNATNVGSVVSLNSNGSDGGCSGGTDSTQYSTNINLSSGNTIFTAVAMRNRTHTAGDGYTETTEVFAGEGGDVSGLAINYAGVGGTGTYPVSGSFNSSTDWSVVALEITGGSTGPTQSPVGNFKGDADGDGDVDENDYNIWKTNRGNTTSQGESAGDFNKDGIVDGVDYVIWLNTFNGSQTPGPTSTAGPTTPPTSTPSPAPEQVVLDLSISAQGVGTQTQSHTLPIRVTAIEVGEEIMYDEVVNFTFNSGSGRYEAEVTLDNVAPGNFDLLVKPPYHLRREMENVSLTAGTNSVNFTNTLIVGDFNGDNVITIVDISQLLSVYTALNIGVNEQNRRYDINWDGVINIIDVSTVLANYTELNVHGD